MMSEVTALDAVEILRMLQRHGIEVVVDGGWAVDAVLGRQTRSHADLDIAIRHGDVPRLRALLGATGFREIGRDDSWACNFVLEDRCGRQVDVHSVTYDEGGRVVFGVAYPIESLSGQGMIAGYPVRCVPPEWLVRFHTGYPLDENDFHDVRQLCQHFGIPIPEEYARFVSA